MKRIILSGCNGRMGKILSSYVKTRNDCTIVAGLDPKGVSYDAFPVFTSPKECPIQADVVIDFSCPDALSPLLEYAVTWHLPVVIATTGLSSNQIALIQRTSTLIPLFFSANMSIGVHVLTELSKKAAAVLGDQFDIEIIERHHNQKIDAPSGTALMLAQEIAQVRSEPMQYVCNRYTMRKKRSKNEIGLHSIRGGAIVGEHEVIFAGPDEILTLSHSASCKEVFASGSINAAIFLCNKQYGLYNMGDLL